MTGARKVPEVAAEVEAGVLRMQVADLVGRLPEGSLWWAEDAILGDPLEAEAAFHLLQDLREEWLRIGAFDDAAVLGELMSLAFVVGCDAAAQGVFAIHDPDWDSPSVGGDPTDAPTPDQEETMGFQRRYLAKVIQDERTRRGAWVTRWRGWFSGRRSERSPRDVAWVRLPQLLQAVQARPGAFALCWVIRDQAWVLCVGWGREVRQAAASKALELGYDVAQRRLAVAVHYTTDRQRAQWLAEDMAWLYAAPLNLQLTL